MFPPGPASTTLGGADRAAVRAGLPSGPVAGAAEVPARGRRPGCPSSIRAPAPKFKRSPAPAQRMRPLALALATLVTLALVADATGECSTTPTTSKWGCSGAFSAADAYYLTWNGFDEPCDFPAFWIYEESNGIAGLQRQDEHRDDTWGGLACAGDTIVF